MFRDMMHEIIGDKDMGRAYKIVFVDDEEKLIQQTIEMVKKSIGNRLNSELEFKVLSSKKEFDELEQYPADVILFDCALYSSDFTEDSDVAARLGLELIKKYRKKNKRTKVIFYSGTVHFDSAVCYDFTNKEMLMLINELHIFKLITKDAPVIARAIEEAIDELDVIISSLEELIYEYYNEGGFLIDGKYYNIDVMLKEIKLETEVGLNFMKEVNKLAITYLMSMGKGQY